MKPAILCFLLVCVTSIKSTGQEYNYHHYDVKDGLSGITAYCMGQDKDGFLWFGTENGLSRFDGSNFKNYSFNEGLNDLEIINLFVDFKNRVWIFPFKNSVYYYYEGKIHNKSNDLLIRKFNLNNEIFKACEDNKGNIFFIEQKKVHIVKNDNSLIEINNFKGKIPDIYTCGKGADGMCNLYVGFTRGTDYLIQVYEYIDSVFKYKSGFLDSGFSRNSLEINPSYSVIQNSSFLRITNSKNNKHYRIALPKDFHSLSYLNDSCFAASTLHKTLVYNINQKKFVDSFLTNELTNRCLSDKENNLWFATMTQGVYRLSSDKFKIYRLAKSMSPSPVFAFNSINKYLYIGSDKSSLWRLNLKTNELEATHLQTKFTINRVSNVQIFGKDSLFFGSNIGLFLYHKNKVISCLKGEASIKSSFLIRDHILIATDRAVFQLSLPDCRKLDTVWHGRATCAIKTGNLYYVGTLNGLYAVKNDFARAIIDIGKQFPVLKDKIIAISPAPDKTIWVATETNGIAGIRNGKLIYHLTAKNGLTSNVCRCIYIDGNKIWVGTNKGISSINITSQQISVRNFTAADGLDCEIINCIYTTGDSVLAGTPFGISFFKDSRISNQPLCNIKLLNIQSKKNNWYEKQDSIYLPSNDNLLRFQYAGISFMSAGDITYYYQLKGFSDDWQSTKQNTLEFQSLRSGVYQFNLYAVNKYGIRSKTVSVSFTKEKPFWQLWWVWGILISVFIALSWLIVITRIKRIKELAHAEVLRERQLNDLEQMALRSQMNWHFVFNSLNSIQQYIFSGDVMEANRFITEFSSLVRQTLYISAKKFIPLEEEIKYLQTYLSLEQVKYENTFNFKVVAEEDLDLETPIPPLLIQPFIENSIRHGVLNLQGEYGKILVHFLIENSHLVCIVEDNGIGRETAKKLKAAAEYSHQSKGMEMVEKRIASLNSIYKIAITVSIEDISGADKTGTKVKLKFPLNYDD